VQIPVLVEPIVGRGFRVRSGEPWSLEAEGTTREDALRQFRQLVQERLASGTGLAIVEVNAITADSPWAEFAGMFKGDAYFDNWQAAIAENRRRADADTDVP
jgi:hypothetical protein